MRERRVTGAAPPWRVFLDTGVIIAGCTRPWGATKAVTILMTQCQRFTLVLGEAVERELTRALLRGETVEAEAVSGWLHRVRQERWPLPAPEDLAQAEPFLLPVLRRQNDLGAGPPRLRDLREYGPLERRARRANRLADHEP